VLILIFILTLIFSSIIKLSIINHHYLIIHLFSKTILFIISFIHLINLYYYQFYHYYLIVEFLN